MCGIAGTVGDTALDREAMLAALAHRGPDHAGGATPSDGVWLGATRLAITDPSPAGNQPFVDGELTVVHNGEIYNHAALRTELGAGRFRSRCDTEVLVHAYRAWGDALVERLDGMFAFALWDAARRRLLLARDRLGIKPLWWTRRGDGLGFASEVRALLAGGVERRLRPRAVAAFLAGGAVTESCPLVRDVEALPPGHVVTLADGRLELRRWWSPPAESTAVLTATDAARAAADVRARLQAAVNSHLHADVPVALFLSGGLDSAALAHLAPRARLDSFHVRIGDAGATRATELAATRGFAHHELRVDEAEAAATVLDSIAAQDLPSGDGANTYLICRAVKHAGLKAAVSGLGGDELFLGYPRHRTYVRARRLQHVLDGAGRPLRRVAQWGARWAARSPARIGWPVEKLFALAAADGPRATYDAARALFPATAAAHLLDDHAPPSHALDGSEAPLDGLSPAGEASRLDLGGYLVDTLLRDADVMSMAHGVELRVPLLDHHLLETVLALPPSLKLHRPKALLVDAVPELHSIAAAPKEGFDLPFDRWLDGGPLAAPVEALLRSPADTARVGLSPPAVERVWRRFCRRRDRASAARVWALYALVAWARTHRMAS